jgi:hypothetical protein
MYSGKIAVPPGGGGIVIFDGLTPPRSTQHIINSFCQHKDSTKKLCLVFVYNSISSEVTLESSTNFYRKFNRLHPHFWAKLSTL